MMIHGITARRSGLALAALVACATAVHAQFNPELVVTAINITPTNPAVGQPIAVEVRAVNAGNGMPEPDTQMHLWHDSPAPPTSCTSADDVQFLGIAFPVETERLFNFTVTYNAAGTYRLHAWVDCPDVIFEADEANNQLFRDITVGLGDLTIDSITPSVADPVPGQSFMLDVVVRNTGPAILGLWRCGVAYQQAQPTGCSFSQTEQRIDFPANGTFTLSFGPVTYNAAGQYPVWAWVNCDENVAEGDLNNNALLETVTLNQPDLVVDEIAVSDVTPTVGQTIDVDVTVRNVGSAAAGAFRLSLVPDSTAEPTGDGCAITEFRYFNSTLDINATTTFSFQVSYSEARQQRLWAWVDSCSELVAEAREDNNLLSRDLNVGGTGGGVDLIVERIGTTEIADPSYGQVVTFDVVVTNVGTVASGPFRVGDFLPSGFPGTLPASYGVVGSPGPSTGGSVAVVGVWNDCAWRSREIANLAPGASATVQFWQFYWESGEHTFSAYADVCGAQSYQRISETSETNNALTVSFEVAGCDADGDRDGICDPNDFCPNVADELNNDSDGDGVGDACDDDDDNDGVEDPNDCDPRNPFAYPGRVEDCTDGIDNDCDGDIDEGAQDWYIDADGDGYGATDSIVTDCAPPTGYVDNGDDCDDSNRSVYPGANGACTDGVDNDCDGVVDNETPIWGRDADGDGFTDPADEIDGATGGCGAAPAGYVLASRTPDPDDTDFMNPEPVTIEPEEIDINRAREGAVAPATLTLQRVGSEPYDYAVAVEYGGGAADWLAVAPPSGTSIDGLAAVQITPNTARLDRTTYLATLHVTVNGAPLGDVPLTLVVRDPILTIQHVGQGGGSAWIEFDEDLNDPLNAYTNTQVLNTRINLFESQISVPEGRSAFLRALTEYDCSTVRGIYDENGGQLNDPNWYYANYYDPEYDDFDYGCDGCTVTPVWIRMDGDRTVTVEYELSGLACTACGPTAMTLFVIGMISNRRRVP